MATPISSNGPLQIGAASVALSFSDIKDSQLITRIGGVNQYVFSVAFNQPKHQTQNPESKDYTPIYVSATNMHEALAMIHAIGKFVGDKGSPDEIRQFYQKHSGAIKMYVESNNKGQKEVICLSRGLFASNDITKTTHVLSPQTLASLDLFALKLEANLTAVTGTPPQQKVSSVSLSFKRESEDVHIQETLPQIIGEFINGKNDPDVANLHRLDQFFPAEKGRLESYFSRKVEHYYDASSISNEKEKRLEAINEALEEYTNNLSSAIKTQWKDSYNNNPKVLNEVDKNSLFKGCADLGNKVYAGLYHLIELTKGGAAQNKAQLEADIKQETSRIQTKKADIERIQKQAAQIGKGLAEAKTGTALFTALEELKDLPITSNAGQTIGEYLRAHEGTIKGATTSVNAKKQLEAFLNEYTSGLGTLLQQMGINQKEEFFNKLTLTSDIKEADVATTINTICGVLIQLGNGSLLPNRS